MSISRRKFLFAAASSLAAPALLKAATPKVEPNFVLKSHAVERYLGVEDDTQNDMKRMFQHTLKGYFTRRPPFAAIRSMKGKVNAARFARLEPEKVLFVGSSMVKTVHPDFGRVWVAELVFVDKPTGWNHFYRPQTGRYERLVHRGSKKPIYQSGDFAELFR